MNNFLKQNKTPRYRFIYKAKARLTLLLYWVIGFLLFKYWQLSGLVRRVLSPSKPVIVTTYRIHKEPTLGGLTPND